MDHHRHLHHRAAVSPAGAAVRVGTPTINRTSVTLTLLALAMLALLALLR
jgi:hypothetical protein